MTVNRGLGMGGALTPANLEQYGQHDRRYATDATSGEIRGKDCVWSTIERLEQEASALYVSISALSQAVFGPVPQSTEPAYNAQINPNDIQQALDGVKRIIAETQAATYRLNEYFGSRR